MAGFLVNGCGASDSHYKIKDVGEFYCNTCKCSRMFALMELKMKIRVFWIPTVPVNTKYAVSCTSCKNGYYVDEQQKEDILYGRSSVEVVSDGVLLHRPGAQPVPQIPQPAPQPTPQPVPEPVPQPIPGPVPEPCPQPSPRPVPEPAPQPTPVPSPDPAPNLVRRFCPKCGSALDQITGLCPHCSPEHHADLFRVPKGKKCPSCNMLFSEEKKFCNICGRRLVDRE